MKTDKLPSEAKQKLFSVLLDEDLIKALKVRAAQSERTVKSIVQDAIVSSLRNQGVKC